MTFYGVEALTAAGVFGSLFLALEIGRWVGRRAGGAAPSPQDPDHTVSAIGALQGALLGLLGLLLAFAFAGSATRFIERQDFVVREANAIGTADLRADLLPEPQRTELRRVLHEYLERRISLHGAFLAAEDPVLRDMERLHRRMWDVAVAGVSAQPSGALLMLPVVNEVIDVHGDRTAAMRRHAPLAVLVLLIVSAMLTLGAVGLGARTGNHRHDTLARFLALLIGASLWLTIDLDYPRAGLVQIDVSPLTSLHITEVPPK
jgi:hypothetical protein